MIGELYGKTCQWGKSNEVKSRWKITWGKAGADPEEGHKGRAPLEKMESHNSLRTNEFFRGVGVGVTWSLGKVKTKISKLIYYQNNEIITT